MNKFVPFMMLVAMLTMLLLSWKNVLGYYGNITESYHSHIEKAEVYMKKRIYIDAVSEYEKALRVKSDDYETAMKIVALYEELHNESQWIKACQNAIDADKTQLEPYLNLADYYIGKSKLQKAYTVLLEADLNIQEDPEITSRILNIKGQYTIEGSKHNIVTSFCFPSEEKTGFAVVSLEDKLGLVNASRKLVTTVEYDAIGPMGQDVIPVLQDHEWFYINEDGYRKLVPERAASYLGTFQNGYAPAQINGVYGYLDKKMKEYHFEYEYAGCFSNGIAPVRKDGKWGIINSSFDAVTGFEFDDILVDEFGFCSDQGVFFAKKSGKWYLFDADGACISDGFDGAKRFVSDEPAAVRIGDQWGFLSKEGVLVINPRYTDANSFHLGYAPFYDGEKWGCIDKKENVVIKPDFDAIMPFLENGCALVELDGVQMYIIVTLYG